MKGNSYTATCSTLKSCWGKCIVWLLWLAYIEDLIAQINHLICFIFHKSADFCCKILFFLVNKLCINFFLHFLLWAMFEKFYEIESISLRFMAGFGSYWVIMTIFVYFRSFQTHITIFFKNQCVKMSKYPSSKRPGFELMTFWTGVVTHNH